VGVGNKSLWFAIPRVQPQVELRQVQAALEADFNQWRIRLSVKDCDVRCVAE
jgi:hypothetical protein